MMPLMLVCAAAGGLAIASALLGLIALTRAGKLFRAAQEQSAAGLSECRSAIDALVQSVENLTRVQHEMEQRMAAAPGSAPPKPALNLTKRSQALRMRRHGDSPEQIASVLEIPRQEVDLLIKVNQIVMSNL